MTASFPMPQLAKIKIAPKSEKNSKNGFFNMKLPRFFLLSIHNHLVYGGFIKITNKK